MVRTLGTVLAWVLMGLFVIGETVRLTLLAHRPATHRNVLMRGLPSATEPAPTRLAQLRFNAWRMLRFRVRLTAIFAVVVATIFSVAAVLEVHPSLWIGMAFILVTNAVGLAGFELYTVLYVWVDYLSVRRRIALDAEMQEMEGHRE